MGTYKVVLSTIINTYLNAKFTEASILTKSIQMFIDNGG